MLIHNGDGIGESLGGGLSIAVLVELELPLVVAQLIEQAIAQVTAGDSGRVQLPYDFDGFVEIGKTEAGGEYGMRNWRWCRCGLGRGWFRRGCYCAAGQFRSLRFFPPC
jgi:hypothetical protein